MTNWLKGENKVMGINGMSKKKIVKKTAKKSSKIKDELNKKLAEKLHERFSGIKTKDKGDGIMEISFK